MPPRCAALCLGSLVYATKKVNNPINWAAVVNLNSKRYSGVFEENRELSWARMSLYLKTIFGMAIWGAA